MLISPQLIEIMDPDPSSATPDPDTGWKHLTGEGRGFYLTPLATPLPPHTAAILFFHVYIGIYADAPTFAVSGFKIIELENSRRPFPGH